MPLVIDQNVTNGIPLLTLKEYLSSNRTLVIPPWQREYTWSTGEDEQIDTLLKDLQKFVQNQDAQEYLFGTVVLCSLSGDEQRPLLIDGQQRTITLSILLMCIQKMLKTNNLIDGNLIEDTTLDSEITACLNSNPYGVMKPKLSMKQSEADETLKEIYQWSRKEGAFNKSDLANLQVKNQTQDNLISATEYIFKRLTGYEKKEKGKAIHVEGNWLSPQEVKDSMRKILNGVKFIQVTVDDKRESISVFDHINNRGLPLNPADLVKNLMFEHVSDKDFVDIASRWAEMSENLLQNKKSRLQDPRYLLRAISHVEYGAHEGYENLDVFWSDKFKRHEQDPKKGVSPIEFSKKLPEYGLELRALVSRDSAHRGDLSEIYLAGEMGSVQHYSVLLAGMKLRKDASFTFLARQVNLRTLLYMLAEERTQLFDSMVPKWAHAIYELDENATIEDLKECYRNCAQPNDSVFADLKDRMSEWNYEVTSQRKKIRSVLGLLSKELNDLCRQDIPIEDVMRTRKARQKAMPYQIDHVLAKSTTKEEIFHTIGNLVLLSPPDNLDASNASPKDKAPYYQNSALVLTRTLNGIQMDNKNQKSKVKSLLKELRIEGIPWNLETWKSTDVDNRADFYFRYLCHIIRSTYE